MKIKKILRGTSGLVIEYIEDNYEIQDYKEFNSVNEYNIETNRRELFEEIDPIEKEEMVIYDTKNYNFTNDVLTYNDKILYKRSVISIPKSIPEIIIDNTSDKYKTFNKLNNFKLDKEKVKFNLLSVRTFDKDNPEEATITFINRNNSIFTVDSNNFLHSYDNKPALENNGEKLWYKHGKLHRKGDKPAVVKYGEDKKVIRKEYWFNGSLHRANGKPAVIDKDEELYLVNGDYHREDNKPSIIRKNNGEVIEEQYQFAGELHCLTGPAYMKKNGNGTEVIKFYINGEKMEKDKWETEANRMKMLNDL